MINKRDSPGRSWADRLLKYWISVLRGRGLEAPRPVIVRYIREVQDNLEREGYDWHSKILGYWFHRYLGGEFTHRPRGAGDPPEAGGIPKRVLGVLPRE